jgi:hypothetical protein
MLSSKNSQPVSILRDLDLQLKKLTTEQVEKIDDVLSSLGEYGEVRLIVQRGVLKYINKVESHLAWNNVEQE